MILLSRIMKIYQTLTSLFLDIKCVVYKSCYIILSLLKFFKKLLFLISFKVIFSDLSWIFKRLFKNIEKILEKKEIKNYINVRQVKNKM